MFSADEVAGGSVGRSAGTIFCVRSIKPARSACGYAKGTYALGANAELVEAFCRIVDEPGRWRRVRDLHRLGVPQIGAFAADL